MLSWITGIYSLIRALLDLWKEIQKFREAQRVEEINKKEKEISDAQKALEEAKTDEEIFAAQERIARARSR